MLTVETMRDDDDDKRGAAVIRGGGGLGLLCERRGAGECMKPRPRLEKPRLAWRNNYSSSRSRSSMALDCLVEVALSPTAAVLSLDLSGRHTAGESVAALRTDNKPSSTSTRPDEQGDEAKGKDDDDDAAMGRYNWSCSSNAVKAPAMAPSPSPGFYQQQQQQQQRQRQEEQKLKLKRGLSSWTTAMSHPAGRSSSSSSSSLRVHADHPHSKRFTPRFKSVLDISC